ncbi:MAG: serine/threonine protein kinase [Pseudomonadales bacterium]|nr:serine/threonine protein kinase [Pseudomonadales bacterium]NRA18387.1 alpha/beta hydrolase [Oceanospirillaceae bacterium]
MKRILLYLLPLMLSSFCYATEEYNYPIDDPIVATVIGTPKDYAAALPKDIDRLENSIAIFPNRPIKTFFPVSKLNYTLVRQAYKAPLIFSIAGTGASHRSAKMQLLEKAFYQAGFHVVSLPSPTYANFIVNASSTQVPGHLEQDSKDLYRVMEMVQNQISNQLEISEYYLTGYSLGGAQAAFVDKLDKEKQIFNFKKVLMINPPVSLFNSVSILDRLLVDNIPGGAQGFNAYFDELMQDFTKIYKESEHIDFSDNFLYRIYQESPRNIDTGRIAALIGISFRLSSANMIFTSDIATNGGYILPKNHKMHPTESTTNYFKVASRISFADYFSERFYPFYRSLNSGISQEDLIYNTSLRSIADYLRSAKNISVVHNEDDIILAPGEINFFRKTFKSRAYIYPKGGHLGNMGYRDNVEFMVNYFKAQEQ